MSRSADTALTIDENLFRLVHALDTRAPLSSTSTGRMAAEVRAARWLGLGRCDPVSFHATYAGIAACIAADSAPVVVCARPDAHLCLGQAQGLCEVAEGIALPVVRRPLGGGAVWVDEHQCCIVLVVPRALAPAELARWSQWALAPLAALYRSFGIAVRAVGRDLWCGERKIAGSGAATIGDAACVGTSVLLRFPAARFARALRIGAGAHAAALAAALAEAVTDWAAQAPPPDPALLEARLRVQIETAFGWCLAAAQPEASECIAIEAAADELREPLEWGRPLCAQGLRLNERLVFRADGRHIELPRGELPARPAQY